MVGTKVCELTDGLLWFVCGLYVGILTSPLMQYKLFLFMTTHVGTLPSAKKTSYFIHFNVSLFTAQSCQRTRSA